VDPKGETPTDAAPQKVVVEKSENTLFQQAEGYFGPVAQVAGQAAFTFILTVFILLKREDLRNRFLRLVGGGRVTLATKVVDDATRRVSRFLFLQLVVNAAFGALIVAGLTLLGVPYAAVWGLFAAILRYVPYLGTWIGLLPPTLLTFATSDADWHTAAVIGLFLGLEAFSNNIVEPRLYGKSLGISEVAQLVAAAFWSFLWGPIGLLLSQPLTTCLLVMGKYIPQLKFLDVLFGDEPALEKPVVFYQRLAARDADEAAALAEAEVRAGRELLDVFDDLAMPALAAARHDLENGELTAQEAAQLMSVLQEAGAEAADAAPKRESAPAEHRPRVLAVPTRDGFDAVAANLLGLAIDANRWDYCTAPATAMSSEILAQIEHEAPAVVLLAGVGPGGTAHTRQLCKRIRAKFPTIKILVGRWAAGADLAQVKDAVLAAGADRVDASLAETQIELAGWAPVLAAPAATSKLMKDDSERVQFNSQL
jgi:hypothetical protein